MLSVATLAAEMAANIETEVGSAPSIPGELTAYCTALAQAIVDRIKGDAVVTASGADPQGGTNNVTGTVS
jgi:hypothetical protein